MPPKFTGLQPGPAKALKILEANPDGLTSREINGQIQRNEPQTNHQAIASWTRIALNSNRCHCRYSGAKGATLYFFGPGFMKGLIEVKGRVDA
jgi:hypothetical protein